jgi:zinc protease
MHPRKFLAILLILLVASWAAAGEPKRVTSVEGITQYQLDNGLSVLLFPDATRPLVTVNMTVFVGSRHEGYGEAGMAHLLEHMMFKGTPSFPSVDKEMTTRGARYNATTWLDRTNYFETLPASDANLDFALHFEAERLVRCPIKAEHLASEMTVVRNEFQMGENSPSEILSQRMLAAAYEWHNYGKSTIGNESDVLRVPADNLRRFYQKNYQPDNAMLIVAGQFDEAKALTLVQKYFGAIPRPERKLEGTYTEEPAQDGERQVTLRRVGDVGIVALLYHVPAGPHEDFPAVQTLEDILTDNPSGRLYQALVVTKKAAAVGGYTPALHDPGFLMLEATVRAEQSSDEVRRIMQETIEKVVEKGVTEEEVNRVKVRFAAARRRAQVDTSQLAVNLSEWAAQGDWRLYFLMRDRMEKVTPQQVDEVAKKYLRTSNRTVGLFIPTKAPDRTAIPAPPDVAALVKDYKGRAAVAAGEQLDPDPMKLEARILRKELAGGIKAAFLPKKTRQEMVVLRLTLRYGNEENLKGLATAAEVLPSLLTRGTKQLTRQQLKDSLDRIEASLGASGGPGNLTFSLQVPQKNLPAALKLMWQVVREPALSEAEFEMLKRQQLASLEENRTDPQSLAPRALARKLSPYGKDDPRYQATVEEEIERLGALKLEQVREVYEQYVGAQAAELAVVGQFELNEIVPAIEEMLGGWKSKLPYARLTQKGIVGLPASLEKIATPDKANAVYIAGFCLAMDDQDPDYPALAMAARVLGGSPASRLWQRIREKGGMSYGVGAGFSARALDADARLRLYAIFGPADYDRLRPAMVDEFERLLKDGVTAEELQRERDALLKQQSMSRTQDSSLAGTIAQQIYTGRTMKQEAEFEQKVQALTPERVTAAARKYFGPAKLAVVVAGDFSGKKAEKPEKEKATKE